MMDSTNLPRNKILCGDCMVGLKELPDGCVDLIMMDPPYLLGSGIGNGMAGFGPVKYLKELDQGTFTEGITNDVLDELVRVMRKINIYIWCNERQIPQYLDYFIGKGCHFNVLTWHRPMLPHSAQTCICRIRNIVYSSASQECDSEGITAPYQSTTYH